MNTEEALRNIIVANQTSRNKVSHDNSLLRKKFLNGEDLNEILDRRIEEILRRQDGEDIRTEGEATTSSGSDGTAGS